MDDQFYYTAIIVEEILKIWDEIEAAKDRGKTVLSPKSKRERKKIESKQAKEQLGSPINDIVEMLADLEMAMYYALSVEEKARLYYHFYVGETYEEIAERVGVTTKATQSSCVRSIKKITDFLNSPRPSVLTPWERPAPIHTRRYTAMYY